MYVYIIDNKFNTNMIPHRYMLTKMTRILIFK